MGAAFSKEKKKSKSEEALNTPAERLWDFLCLILSPAEGVQTQPLVSRPQSCPTQEDGVNLGCAAGQLWVRRGVKEEEEKH